MAPCNEQHCTICRFPGADVLIQGCGCMLHARCLPVTSIVSEKSLVKNEKKAVAPGEVLCPACNMSPLASIKLLPMTIDDLDRAVVLRKKEASKKQTKANLSGSNASFVEVQAESSYLLLSHGSTSASLSSDNDYQRTGRWTEEEIAFTDFLVEAFDNGKLPIEHGMKLNEFLSEILLCKSSRLTKKMKNAKLSIRSYDFKHPPKRIDAAVLSELEQKFLQSITSEASRYELRFNLTRMWRSRLSNLCLQIESTLLDASEWFTSLEEMERRAVEAEENIRRARRKRMGLALRKDVKEGKDGVFFAGVPCQRLPKKAKSDAIISAPITSSNIIGDLVETGSVVPSVGSMDESDSDFITSMLDLGDDVHPAEDYSKIFNDLAGGPPVSQVSRHLRNNCGPFLEEIINYMETNNLPFQHVDVWVPSYPKGSNGVEGLRLYHAGHATRSDVDAVLYCQLNEYGEYSTKFSFASGVGLPGRVFSNDEPRWERQIHEADPQFFERAGGAKVYGVKTGFGFPLSTSVIGRIVVTMYSVEDVVDSCTIVDQCCRDLARLCPEPKWKLVVDMGAEAKKSLPSRANSVVPSASITYGRSNSVSTGSRTRVRDDDSAHSGLTGRQSIHEEDGNLDHRIASLLGDHMPLSALPQPGQGGGVEPPSALIPHFMSLRLLLLRSGERRTPQENDTIDIIRKSFIGYARDTRRSDQDLAHLIVKDWQYLRAAVNPASSTTSSSAPTTAPPMTNPLTNMLKSAQNYQSHVINLPVPSNGAPSIMPRPLPFMDAPGSMD